MKFDAERYEELLESFMQLLQTLTSNSYTNSLANLFIKHFKEPHFTDEFWTQFNTNFKKLIDLASKYTALNNEDPKRQLEVKRLLAIVRMVNPMDLMAQFKRHYSEDNGDDLAKKKLRVFIKAYLNVLPSSFQYIEEESNDYDIKFKLQSVDNKRVVSFDVSIDNHNRITVFGKAHYKDHDFEFEIEEIQFDPLLFPTLESCVDDLMKKLEIRVAMKVSGTRIKIASYIFVLSKKDLAIAKADLLKEGETFLWAVTGERIVLTAKPEGRLLDSMNTNLFGVGKLYFNLAPEKKETLVEETKQAEEVKEINEAEKPKDKEPKKEEKKKEEKPKEEKKEEKKESKKKDDPSVKKHFGK